MENGLKSGFPLQPYGSEKSFSLTHRKQYSYIISASKSKNDGFHHIRAIRHVRKDIVSSNGDHARDERVSGKAFTLPRNMKMYERGGM